MSDTYGTPPRLAEWILARAVGTSESGRSILGDARELFQRRRERGSGARLWYWRFALGVSIRFAFVSREPDTSRAPGGFAAGGAPAGPPAPCREPPPPENSPATRDR